MYRDQSKICRSVIFLRGAGPGMTGPQEDSNEGKLCLPLKMGGGGGQGGTKGEEEIEDSGCGVNRRARS
jgi:hypothetical protein